MKTITLTDEELSLIHEHLICLYDLICLLSWSAMYEQKDSYICEVKHKYQHILVIILGIPLTMACFVAKGFLVGIGLILAYQYFF